MKINVGKINAIKMIDNENNNYREGKLLVKKDRYL